MNMPNASCLMGLFLPVCTIGSSGMYLTPTLIQAPRYVLGPHRQIRCNPCPRERRWGKNGKRGHWHTQGEGYSHLIPNVGYIDPPAWTTHIQCHCSIKTHTGWESTKCKTRSQRRRCRWHIPYVFSLVQSSEETTNLKTSRIATPNLLLTADPSHTISQIRILL